MTLTFMNSCHAQSAEKLRKFSMLQYVDVKDNQNDWWQVPLKMYPGRFMNAFNHRTRKIGIFRAICVGSSLRRKIDCLPDESYHPTSYMTCSLLGRIKSTDLCNVDWYSRWSIKPGKFLPNLQYQVNGQKRNIVLTYSMIPCVLHKRKD